MSINVEHQIQMSPEIASYFYGQYRAYVEQNPEDSDLLTFGAYLGNVVLGSLKSLFEGKVPQIYDPNPKEGE